MLTTSKNNFEVVAKTVVATVNGKMYQVDLYSEKLKKWFMLTYERNTKTDNNLSLVPFDDEEISLIAQDWKELFWLVMDEMHFELVEALVGIEIDSSIIH